MNRWNCLLLIGLAGCASPKPATVAVRPMPASTVGADSAASIRYLEAVKGYHLGRYIEPNDRFVMHEQHTVYRVEALATWNLHPGQPCFTRPPSLAGLTNAAFSPAPLNDEIIAELAHQKQVTHVVTTEASRLGTSLQQLGQALTEVRSIATENHQLHQQLTGVLKRIESLEAEIKKVQTARVPTDTPPEPQPKSETKNPEP